MPTNLDKPAGKCGKMAKSDAHGLLKGDKSMRLSEGFAKNMLVPCTSNRGERDLRISQVEQKVSGCFPSEVYAHTFCCIPSYLQIMAYNEVNPMIAILQ